MRTVLLTILVLLVAPTIAVPAAGNNTEPPPTCQWTTSSATFTIGPGQAGTRTYYIVVDYLEENQVGGVVWLYQEINLQHFLQRNDFVKDDTCNGWIVWDRIII